MIIQVDTREKPKAIKTIMKTFADEGIKTISSKLYVGDYMSLDNPHVVVDRKQNLNEVCSNLCSQEGHERFSKECDRARDAGIKVYVLVEHGEGITSKMDVIFWQNPRKKKNPKAPSGVTLFKTMETFEEHHGCTFLFCSKADTGKRIIQILSDISHE